MRFSRQFQQVPPRTLHIRRLVKQFLVKRERLVAAEHQPAGSLADVERLGLGQHLRHILRRCAGTFERLLDRALVDLRGDHVNVDARRLQHRLAERAARGKALFSFDHLEHPTNGN